MTKGPLTPAIVLFFYQFRRWKCEATLIAINKKEAEGGELNFKRIFGESAIRYKSNYYKIYSPVFQARNCRIILHHRQLINLSTGWDETFFCVSRHGYFIVSGCECGRSVEEQAMRFSTA
jgi:hypothetical protein